MATMGRAATAVATEAAMAATTTTGTEPSDRLCTQAAIRPATAVTLDHTTITTRQPWFLTVTTTITNQVTTTCTTVDMVVVIAVTIDSRLA